MKAKYLFLPLMCGLLLSCEGNPLDTTTASRTVQVNAVKESTQTRVTDGVWDAGDAIGLFMIRSGDALNEAALVQNVKYVTSGGVNFLPENESERILFPFNVSDVDIIGYHPFTTAIDGFMFPVDVSDQSNQSAINLLYSNNATGLNARIPHANMSFRHQLAKIELNIRSENNETDLSGLTVRLTNTGTHAQFSLIDGTMSPPSAYGNIVFRTAANGRFSEATVLPTTDLSGKHLVFEINGVTYLFALNSSLNIHSFNKSIRYIYNVTLNPQSVSVTIESSIEDWINGPSEDITLDPNDGDIPDFSKGTKNNPFTIAEARENSGRTGVWVEGYIVGFYLTTARTSFVNNFDGEGEVLASQSNLALAIDKSEDVATNTFPVMLGSGAIRNQLNLRANPEHFKRRILLRGTLGTYMATVGLRDLTDFEFVE
jgi:hypothetical protein